MEPLDDNETNNANTSAEIRKKRTIRYIAIALTVGVITLACIWLATRLKNNEMTGAQFEDMYAVSAQSIFPVSQRRECDKKYIV